MQSAGGILVVSGACWLGSTLSEYPPGPNYLRWPSDFGVPPSAPHRPDTEPGTSKLPLGYGGWRGCVARVGGRVQGFFSLPSS